MARRVTGNSLDRYVDAATRENTRRSYRSAVKHFEEEWGGFLPASADSVARYFADQAQTLSVNTLRQRLAALAQWHLDQGFPDPTKAAMVRKVLRGIQAVHPVQEKHAKPLQVTQLEQLVRWLDTQVTQASQGDDRAALLKHTRDKALLLIGFWRGFRSDELTRLRVEHVTVVPGEGMSLYLTRTKGDREGGAPNIRPQRCRACVRCRPTRSGLSEQN